MSVSASAQSAPRVAVVVLLRPATLDDWKAAPAPNLHRLLDHGAVALMNTRAARVSGDRSRESVSSAVLTLGAGARGACDPRNSVFTQAQSEAFPGVSASDLFQRRTELRIASDDLAALNWPRILSANSKVGYRVIPGSLGGALRNTGVNVYATNGLAAPLVAADAEGAVASCNLDFLHLPPPGISSAYFIDAPLDWPAADRLLGEAFEYTTQDGARLIVLSPAVNDHEYAAGSRLAPIVISGLGIKPGLLKSRSTRTPGLIANTDVAGFIAGYFGAALDAADSTAEIDFKRPSYHPETDFAALPASQPIKSLERIDRRAMEQRQGMKALPVFAVIASLFIIAMTVLQRRGDSIHPALLLLPTAAILMFVLSESVNTLFSLSFLPLAVLMGVRAAGGLRVLRWLCAWIWIMAVVHMLAPHGFLKFSLLGYSIIEGARYYGIGNEMMGALAGAVLVAADGAESKWARRVVLLLVLITVGMVGAPQIGAKAGGVIVSVGTLLVYFGSLRGVRWNVGRAALVVGAALMAVFAVALLDSHFNPGRQSHLGQAVMGLRQSGGSEWADIVTRKLAVEGRLLWRSAWALLLWGAVAGVLTSRRAVFASGSTQTRAIYQAGLAAIGLSVAFNDAGAVAGALCAALLWSYWSLKTTGSRNDPRSSFEPAPSA